jgi:hypothetical protein
VKLLPPGLIPTTRAWAGRGLGLQETEQKKQGKALGPGLVPREAVGEGYTLLH